MRIISGELKGRNIHPPKNFNARPTTDFAKESLFNIILNNFDFDTLNIIDLFSGTGSISFEFASRGAVEITAVENNFNHYSFIKKTADNLQLAQIKVIKANAFIFLKRCTSSFNIIFADPPYADKNTALLPDLIFENNLLKENGWFILEHSKDFSFQNYSRFFDQRIYGSVNFSIFK